MLDRSLWYRLFWLFRANVIISCLAVGGGYVIIPLIKKQFVDDKRVFSFDDLMEMAAVAQSAPGAIAINMAALTGYRIAGFIGAAVSCVGSILPPLIIMSVVAICYEQLVNNPQVNAALKGMTAAIAALMINVVIDMGKNVVRNKEALGIFLMLAVFAAAFVFNVNAILLIIVSVITYTLFVRICHKDGA